MIKAQVMAQIEEVKYLATENTWRYRMIIRLMYRHYDQLKYWLSREEIYAELLSYQAFAEYTMEQLKADLEALTGWHNLSAVADTARVKTIEEFKNRDFRYQLTPYSIELERMLINLEQHGIEHKATLEASLVAHFYQLLQDFPETLSMTDQAVFEWWRSLNSAFKDLNQSYQDYIGKFYSTKADEMMKTTAFLLYKENFVNYLRNFIRNLQSIALDVEQILQGISNEELEVMLLKVQRYDLSVLDLGDEGTDGGQDFLPNNRARFASMREWFVSENGHISVVERLIENTSEIIRKITRYAAQIADRRNSRSNRKEDYRRLAAMFAELDEVDEAHVLAAEVFGVPGAMHLLGDLERATESINSGIFEEAPLEVILTPRLRGMREKVVRSAIADKTEAKRVKREAIMQRRHAEEETIDKFIVDGCIDFGAIKLLEPHERSVLLKWLTAGRKKQAKTEFGRIYQVRLAGPETIILPCSDGGLQMPHYVLVFEGGA